MYVISGGNELVSHIRRRCELEIPTRLTSATKDGSTSNKEESFKSEHLVVYHAIISSMCVRQIFKLFFTIIGKE